MGLDIHNAETVHPERQDLKPDEDFLTLDPEATMRMTIAVIEVERAFVVRSGAPGEPPQPPGDFFKGEIACTWGFYLEPLSSDVTRLVIRWRAAWADTRATRATQPILLEPMHFIMGGAHAARHPRQGGAQRLTYHA